MRTKQVWVRIDKATELTTRVEVARVQLVRRNFPDARGTVKEGRVENSFAIYERRNADK